MRTSVLTMLVCILLLSTTADAQKRETITGNKNYVTQKVDVNKLFSALSIYGSMDVHYTQTSGTPSVEIYGASNIIPYIETTVDKGTLVFRFRKNTTIRDAGKLEIRVSGPALSLMSISGSGDIYLKKGMNTKDNLEFKISGSGDINGEKIKCTQLKMSISGSGDISLQHITSNLVSAKISGSGDIKLSGDTNEAEFDINGSGDITADKLKAETVTVKVSGSGDIKCFATRKLTGRISGSGDIGYKGNPEIDFPNKKGLYKL